MCTKTRSSRETDLQPHHHQANLLLLLAKPPNWQFELHHEAKRTRVDEMKRYTITWLDIREDEIDILSNVRRCVLSTSLVWGGDTYCGKR